MSAVSSVQTSDNGFLLAGSIYMGGFSSVWLLIKTDSIGNLQWNKTYGGQYGGGPQKIIQTNDGNYVMAGATGDYGPIGLGISFDTIRANVYVIKVDPNGNVLWAYAYGDTLEDVALDIAETQNGDLVMTGYTNEYGLSPVGNMGDILLMCISPDGMLKWSRAIYSPNGWEDLARNIIVAADGGFYLSGVTRDRDNAMGFNVVLLKTDSMGNILWSKTMDEPSAAYRGMVADNHGGVVFGYGTANFSPSGDLILADIDSTGNPVWSQVYGIFNGSGDNMQALIKSKDSSSYLFACGGIGAKIDSVGNVLWAYYTFSNFGNGICSVIEKKDRGFVLPGTTSSLPQQICFIEMDSSGYNCESIFFSYPFQPLTVQTLPYSFTDSILSFVQDSGFIAQPIMLSDTTYCFTATVIVEQTGETNKINIYPNPFTEYLYINSAEKINNISISIYDISGRLVYNSIHFKNPLFLGDLEDGFYVLLFKANNSTQIIKILKTN